MVYASDEQADTDFLFNMETITAFNNRTELIKVGAESSGVQGIVFGRVDFSGSLGLGREGIDSEQVTDSVIEVAKLCKETNLDLVMGGAISIDALSIVKKVAEIKLTRFETRKVVFNGEALKKSSIESGLLNAVHFELLWLTNKRDYYGNIVDEDQKRIELLESRWKILNTEV